MVKLWNGQSYEMVKFIKGSNLSNGQIYEIVKFIRNSLQVVRRDPLAELASSLATRQVKYNFFDRWNIIWNFKMINYQVKFHFVYRWNIIWNSHSILVLIFSLFVWFLFLSLGIFHIWRLLWKKIEYSRLHQVKNYMSILKKCSSMLKIHPQNYWTISISSGV